ncbi:hypothetical protein HOP50_13g68600 [Chloropicon primus]|nr:hypothetical protein HOP50_13g68600 [Chloropicon primus]
MKAPQRERERSRVFLSGDALVVVTRRASKRQRIEPKHALEVLPGSAWRIIGKHVADYDRVAFGLTCKTFLEAVTMATTATATAANPEQKKKVALKTDLKDDKLIEQMPCFSLGWLQWAFQSFKRKKGAAKELRDGRYYDHLYDCDLMYLAAFQGSKKVMEWLVSQGICLDIGDWKSVEAAASGGHIHVLKWLGSEGCL